MEFEIWQNTIGLCNAHIFRLSNILKYLQFFFFNEAELDPGKKEDPVLVLINFLWIYITYTVGPQNLLSTTGWRRP